MDEIHEKTVMRERLGNKLNKLSDEKNEDV
jgi:hypothetical protein